LICYTCIYLLLKRMDNMKTSKTNKTTKLLKYAVCLLLTFSQNVYADSYQYGYQQRENNIRLQGMVERQIIWMQHHKKDKLFLSVLHSYHELCKSLVYYYNDNWCTQMFTNKEYLILAFKKGV